MVGEEGHGNLLCGSGLKPMPRRGKPRIADDFIKQIDGFRAAFPRARAGTASFYAASRSNRAAANDGVLLVRTYNAGKTRTPAADTRESVHATVARAVAGLRRARLRLLSELLLGRRDRASARRGRQHPQARPAGGLAREKRRAAHRLRRAHVQ